MSTELASGWSRRGGLIVCLGGLIALATVAAWFVWPRFEATLTLQPVAATAPR